MKKLLNINLEINKNYINPGNIFSKSILLQELNNTKCQDGMLFIVDNEKKKIEYKKIFDYLKIKYIDIDNISSLIDLIYNKNNSYLYIVEKELFEANLPNTYTLESKLSIKLKKNETIEIDKLLEKLNEFGYSFADFLENGNFKKTGDTVSIHSLFSKQIYRINFWGDTIEDILLEENGETQKVESISIGKLDNILFPPYGGGQGGSFNDELLEQITKNGKIIITDELDFYNFIDKFNDIDNIINLNSLKNQEKQQINLGIQDVYLEKIDELTNILNDSNFSKKIIFTKNKKSISNFLEYNNLTGIKIFETKLNNLKSFNTINTLILCDDNLSRIFVKKRIKRSLAQNMDLLLQIKPGDFIVHIDHGIGIFKQILEKDLSGVKKEYIELGYKNNDKLFVPISEIYRVSKYVGSENPTLTPLNTKEWEKKIKKVNEDVEQIAGELLEIYAKRQLQLGYKFEKFEEKEKAFQASFPYIYTEDQIKVIEEIFSDMESELTMDRLLSGDVGFGKTEIAFNAIYKAIINGKQAALISPLVVLAYEHYDKALDRFRDFGIKVEVLTRFEKASVIKNTLSKLKSGEIDLIVGTHRLLSEDIVYKKLGLLVVDEEHKFGVKDKEKIKNMKGNIDILSMSATPIPRSLNMALSGIRSISMLTTPPYGRKNTQTYVSKFDDNIIMQAGKQEFERGGQLFFIHNRVETIDGMKAYLEQLFPHKSVIITHGQLPGDELEKRIIEFKRKQYDILLSTTVIENGIDFSNVNTIIINDSYKFGISQIHQLRGRVGRSDRQGYCYLLYKKDQIKEDAAKRLKTLVDYSHLGAGFELAVRDLEIRGGGDILGIKQSGHSKDIGVNLFIEMLENKVEELKNKVDNKDLNNSEIEKKESEKQNNKKITTTIDLNISAFIPDEFFSSELDKINFYREIESLNNLEDLDNIISDFKEVSCHSRSLHGNLAIETENLFNLLRLKIISSKYKVKAIKKVGINYQIDFNTKATLDDLKKFLLLDQDVTFTVINGHRVRSEVSKFKGDEFFLEFMLNFFRDRKTGEKKKIKLKKKKD